MISIGRISGALGLKGELKVTINPDFKEFILTNYKKINFYSANGDELKIDFKRKQPKFLIFTMEGITDRTQAETIGKIQIFCKKSLLPELRVDEFYNSDLIGLDIYEDNKNIGKIQNVANFGAGDIVEILLTDGNMVMYPFTKAIFHTFEKDRVIITAPKFT